jgi:hypothetical protein
MTYRNYIIEYTAKAKNGAVLKSGKMRAISRLSAFEAQVKFEDFLKKKYPNFGQLIVHKCYVDNPLSSIFGDILGKDNPFGF